MEEPTRRRSPTRLPATRRPDGNTSAIPKTLRATAALDEFGIRSFRTKKATTGTKTTNRLESRAEADAPESSCPVNCSRNAAAYTAARTTSGASGVQTRPAQT